MNRDTIVELISDNRLQEALQALEKLTRGTHLHNQVIVLSSSYAEYSQLNRNATQDFQTLEMQRTRISNSLLSFLDELSPDDYQKVARIEPVKQLPAQSSNVNYKWLLIGGSGVLVILLVIGLLSKEKGESTSSHDDTAAQTEQTIQQGSIGDQAQTTPTTEVNTSSLKLVEFGKNSEILGVYRQINEENWIEKSYSTDISYKFKELNRDLLSIYLHDPKRNIDIKLDFKTHAVYYSDINRTDVEIYKIINAQ